MQNSLEKTSGPLPVEEPGHDAGHHQGAHLADVDQETALPAGGERADSLVGESTDAEPGADTDPETDVAGQSVPAPAAPTLAEVLVAIEELWPDSLAEGWDRVGLVTGRLDSPVQRILFAVDPTLEVIADAAARKVDLLITHHPLLLKGVNSVAATTAKGRAIHELIENRIALVTVHTNGDSAVGGVSDVIADALGLTNVEVLAPASNGLPEEGIGRVGHLPELLPLSALAARLAGFLPTVAGGIRVAGDKDALVRKVALCGGAGDSLFDEVRRHDADVYITSDLRHHPASEARETALGGRPYLIDVSHFASEWLWLPAAALALSNVLEDSGFPVETDVSQINTDPWDFILTPHGD